MKKNLVVSLTLLLTLVFITGCGCSRQETEENNGTIVESNMEVIQDQMVEVFTFTNTSLIYENGNSILETAVTNTSDVEQSLVEIHIHVKDEAGNEIVQLTGFVGNSIGAHETKLITNTYGEDLTDAKSIEYEIIR